MCGIADFPSLAFCVQVELGMVPIDLKLPLAKLLQQQDEIREEERQQGILMAQKAAAVRRAELAVAAHNSIAARVLDEMQAMPSIFRLRPWF